jgi:hypothetical protein
VAQAVVIFAAVLIWQDAMSQIRHVAAPKIARPIFSRPSIAETRAAKEPTVARAVPAFFFDDTMLLRAARLRPAKVAADAKPVRAATTLLVGTVSALTLLRQFLPSHWSLAPRGQTGVRARGLLACHPSQAISCIAPDPASPLFVR